MPEPAADQSNDEAGSLRRVVGVPGAVLMGLGSILGTGVFVSIGLGADLVGAGVVVAVLFAAVIATANGLSSAQLAANHPVSGGTYEYGYRYLNPWLGFSAGWMFLCAKTASAATAALGLAGYISRRAGWDDDMVRIVFALVFVVLLTTVVAGGMRRSNRMNAVIVAVTLVTLGILGVAGASVALDPGTVEAIAAATRTATVHDIAHATALMFVAYTGYGRIATLGEEIREPARSIPRAIMTTLAVSALLYAVVATVAVGTLGAPRLAEVTRATAAPLEAVGGELAPGWLPTVVAVGAITAMAGVVLNLLLGISRVVLAMARRGDLPGGLAAIDARRGSPTRAVLFTGLLMILLTCLGSVKTTWTFSAFTVLIYYGLTNLAALRLSPEERRFPRAISVFGMVSCLAVAAFVEPEIWAAGLGVLAIGIVGRFAVQRRR